ncbi:hypothetical protein L1987_85296 [Smallanthus sonchifolius]|uniref:Uncharacterized protein n=1 Tax=Smallanthus sonchifolius TaxID=185202 RepID=A0ACB8XWK2_9ASTR|nr:hypothetical protein L1987_85296 [Smallanthus sonchifolius]
MPSTRALLATNHSLVGRSGSAFQVRYPNHILCSTRSLTPSSILSTALLLGPILLQPLAVIPATAKTTDPILRGFLKVFLKCRFVLKKIVTPGQSRSRQTDVSGGNYRRRRQVVRRYSKFWLIAIPFLKVQVQFSLFMKVKVRKMITMHTSQEDKALCPLTNFLKVVVLILSSPTLETTPNSPLLTFGHPIRL